MKFHIFVYGGLLDSGKGYDMRLHGEMRYRTRGDPGARFGSEFPGWVYGQVHICSRNQTVKLMHFEAPQYALRAVGRVEDMPLYAFEDVEPDFEKEKVIPDGKWLALPYRNQFR